MNIALGTMSKRKASVVKSALSFFLEEKEIEIIPHPSKSLVSETPWNEETCIGAKNRALECKAKIPEAEYFVGLESGLVERCGHIFEEAWACAINKDGKEYYGYSSGLKLPDFILRKMHETNLPHFKVMNILDKEEGRINNDDTWGTYSEKMIIRDVSLEEAVRNAFVQIFSPQKSYYHR